MLDAIGIPVLSDLSTINERNDALIKAAYIYNIPVYIYRMKDAEKYFSEGKIPAFFWDGNQYCKCEIELPKFTEITAGTSRMTEDDLRNFKILSKETSITDRFGLSKQVLQQLMLMSDLSKYAIPTIMVNSFSELLTWAPVFSSTFVKPAHGRKARGAMKLEKREGKLFYSTPEGTGELTEEALWDYYASYGYPRNTELLLEPCLNILNDDGCAVDFRCLVSLNGEGQWENVMTYARIGGSNVASNFSHGGSLNFAEEVLEQLIPGHGEEKLREINELALKVAELVREKSPNPVSWLGLDICIDRPSNQVYVIEANSKPGTKLVGPWPLSLVRAQYFRFLLSQKQNEKG